MNNLDPHALVRKLVATWHLNVPERAALPNGKAPLSLVVSAIEELLRANDSFPPGWRADSPFDGGLIQLQDKELCRLTWKAEVGLQRFEVVDEQSGLSVREACMLYAHRAYKHGIDGIPIDWEA